jgi:hypothetical protein
MLQTFLFSPSVPDAILEPLTNLLIDAALSEDRSTEGAKMSRNLLAVVNQRHFRVYNKAFDSLELESNYDTDVLEQLRLSLSLVILQPCGFVDNY